MKCAHESGGKRVVGRNNKIGNAHLKWAFGEAACLFLRESDQAKALSLPCAQTRANRLDDSEKADTL